MVISLKKPSAAPQTIPDQETPDAGDALATDAATTSEKPKSDQLAPYDENEDWDSEFLDDDWDKKFMEK